MKLETRDEGGSQIKRKEMLPIWRPGIGQAINWMDPLG